MLGVTASVNNTLLVQGAHYVQKVIIGNDILFCPLKHSMVHSPSVWALVQGGT